MINCYDTVVRKDFLEHLKAIFFTSKQFFVVNMRANEDAFPPVKTDEVQMSELSATTNLFRAEHNSIEIFKLVIKLNRHFFNKCKLYFVKNKSECLIFFIEFKPELSASYSS